MTRWGVLLLVAYIALGLGPFAPRQAMRYAIWLTAVVLVIAGFSTGAL
jgi:hypothetical protein